jgi:metal-responsive CopG/Arc/MetJ family transcriptional regulator
VTLPEHLAAELDSEVGARKKSAFIALAIEEKLKEIKEKRLKAELAEGYTACREEGLALAREFERADLEGWPGEDWQDEY